MRVVVSSMRGASCELRASRGVLDQTQEDRSVTIVTRRSRKSFEHAQVGNANHVARELDGSAVSELSQRAGDMHAHGANHRRDLLFAKPASLEIRAGAPAAAITQRAFAQEPRDALGNAPQREVLDERGEVSGLLG